MLNKNFTPFPVLVTDRLRLRQLLISDDQEIFTLRTDSIINKILDRQLSLNIADARNFINTVKENVKKNVAIYWAITFSHQNKLVGTVCIYGFSEENGNCEIGYELLPNFEGQGIMFEAVEKVIDYAFNTIKVEKIEAFLHRDNQRSIKLLEKCSFKKSNNIDQTKPKLLSYQLANPSYNLE